MKKRLKTPFYDPRKSYEENFQKGPFGGFKKTIKVKRRGLPKYNFLGFPVYLPFGIPAGPLPNAKFIKAALQMGFDIPVYKTVRTGAHPCHPWPNVLPVKTPRDLTLRQAEKGLTTKERYRHPLSITNSFGVPSNDPKIWQPDLEQAVKAAGPGQVVIGSFQGTKPPRNGLNPYIKDFVLGARLMKETGVKVLEANLSCPNEGSCDLLCFDVNNVQKIATAIKNEIGNTPLLLKLAYFKDQKLLQKFVSTLGKIVDGFAAINTIGAKIYNKKGEQALPGEGRLVSGVCGSSIRWAGLDMTHRLKKIRQEKDLNFTIVGVGGINKPAHYFEYLKTGADAAMSATGAMWNPYLAKEIQKELDKKSHLGI